MSTQSYKLKLINLGIDTQNEFMIFVHANCTICKLEGIETLTRVQVNYNRRSIIATLATIHSDIISCDEACLSESAQRALNIEDNVYVHLSHLSPTSSFPHVRAKIFGHKLDADAFTDIIDDVVANHYSNVQLSSFITACAHNHLDTNEITHLTRAMIQAGEQIRWDYPIVVDKHSVGGIPGNRTTPIVVAIVASAGLIIPKTSSRAITSPAGTADTIETMTNVTLSISKVKHVVDKEGGCMVWGGAIGTSPADDIIIRVERSLDLDPEGQMIASVLSKKAAIGATHVIIDIPVGKTAKIRSSNAFIRLKEYFTAVGKAVGLEVRVLKTDGIQPLGRGIGPALEAKDILAILNNNPDAPRDLKNKAILLASHILELAKKVPPGTGQETAAAILESGAAYNKFIAICEAQGGFQVPPTAPYTYDIVAPYNGRITEVDNRNLALVAKLAGAPQDKAAGIEFFAKQGKSFQKGQALYRIHAMNKSALDYSVTFAKKMTDIIKIMRD